MMYRTVVYKLTFPDGKVYIGSTGSEKTRWASDGRYYTGAVAEAIKHFGWENVVKERIIKMSPTVEHHNACLAVERELIRAYDGRSYNVLGTEPNNHIRTAHLRKQESEL